MSYAHGHKQEANPEIQLVFPPQTLPNHTQSPNSLTRGSIKVFAIVAEACRHTRGIAAMLEVASIRPVLCQLLQL